MAGTKTATEALPGFVCETALSSASTPQNSVEGISTKSIQDRATCYVRATDRSYRYFQASTTAPSGTDVILPADTDVADPGRWIIVPEPEPATTTIEGALISTGGSGAIAQHAATELTAVPMDLSGSSSGMNEPSNGRLGNSSGVTHSGRAWASADVQIPKNQSVTLELRKNGVEIPGATAKFYCGADESTLFSAVNTLVVEAPIAVSLADTDYLSIFESSSGDTDATYVIERATISFASNPL